jgi:hypothetical protein
LGVILFRERITLKCMFYPKLILPKDVSTTELASLPVQPQLLLACIFGQVLVDLSNFKSQPAFFAHSEHMGLFTLLQKMFSKLPKINQ